MTPKQSYTTDEETRRSRSLDGDMILGPGLMHQLDKNKNRSAWSKVKGIVKTHRSSIKSPSKSSKSGQSRDASPCDSIETNEVGPLPFN